MSIVAWISGHGYGHLAQLAPVLELLAQRLPTWPVIIRTSIPPEIVRQRLKIAHRVIPGAVDTGVVQHSAIHENWPATAAKAERFYEPTRFARQCQTERRRLAPLSPRLMLSDISPLAFPVASLLGIPSVALCNLDWHDIYQPHLGEKHPQILRTIAAAHTKANLLLRMPWHMPMQTFPVVKDIPVVLPQPCQSTKNQIRQKLALADEQRTLVLVLFGGTQMPNMNIIELARLQPQYLFLFLSRPTAEPLPENVHVVHYGQPFTSRELMQAADLVLCKPGYGVLSEAWNANIPLVYAPRSGFPEYPYMHQWLQQHAPSALLDEASLTSGHWKTALAAASQSTRCWPKITEGQAEQHIMNAIFHLL